jgi:hypothetical protein
MVMPRLCARGRRQAGVSAFVVDPQGSKKPILVALLLALIETLHPFWDHDREQL